MPERERILFITGRLAEPLVRKTVAQVAAAVDIEPVVETLGISVAALMHSGWLARKLEINAPYDRVIVPGWCQGDLAELTAKYGVPFQRGPKEILHLGEFFGLETHRTPDLSRYDIEIVAEINHAPRLPPAAMLDMARHFRESGADVIDVGCIPGERWAAVGDAVRMLRDEGFRVSIDSFDRDEVEAGVAAGAELVLSVNSSNIDWAASLPAEWVAIPDAPEEPEVLNAIVGRLTEAGRAFR